MQSRAVARGAARPAPSWVKRLVATSAALVVLLMSAWLIGTSYSIYHPRPFDQPRLDEAVRWVRADRAAGVQVTLPPTVSGVSIDGTAWAGGGTIFFPSWIGTRTLIPTDDEGDVEGYLFSARPQTEGAFLNGPYPGQLSVGSHIRGNWYRVLSWS